MNTSPSQPHFIQMKSLTGENKAEFQTKMKEILDNVLETGEISQEQYDSFLSLLEKRTLVRKKLSTF
jgi:polyhydroxyalkanoate synthesis regulator phasin